MLVSLWWCCQVPREDKGRGGVTQAHMCSTPGQSVRLDGGLGEFIASGLKAPRPLFTTCLPFSKWADAIHQITSFQTQNCDRGAFWMLLYYDVLYQPLLKVAREMKRRKKWAWRYQWRVQVEPNGNWRKTEWRIKRKERRKPKQAKENTSCLWSFEVLESLWLLLFCIWVTPVFSSCP